LQISKTSSEISDLIKKAEPYIEKLPKKDEKPIPYVQLETIY
jgi:hypothetical protein